MYSHLLASRSKCACRDASVCSNYFMQRSSLLLFSTKICINLMHFFLPLLHRDPWVSRNGGELKADLSSSPP